MMIQNRQKAANPHINKAGTGKYFKFLLKK